MSMESHFRLTQFRIQYVIIEIFHKRKFCEYNDEYWIYLLLKGLIEHRWCKTQYG